MIDVERTDFVPLATRDKERALEFYGETLGLKRNERAHQDWPGVEFHGETLDTGVCHMAFFSDPDGNALMLHRRYAPYSDGSKP